MRSVASGRVFDAVLQRGAFQQLHGDEVLVALAADVVDRADVRMVEGGSGPRFALETLQRLRVAGDLRRQELEGHKAAQARVLRLVDDAHAAAAQLLQYLIMRNRSSDHPPPRKQSRKDAVSAACSSMESCYGRGNPRSGRILVS